MLTLKLIPEQLLRKLSSWQGMKMEWLIRASLAEQFYYNDVGGTGTNYTPEQLAKIKETTNIPVTINYVHPITNQKLALLVHNKPSHRVVANDNDKVSKQYAFMLDKMKHGVMYNSDADSKTEAASKDMLITGMGAEMVVPKDFYQPGEFEIGMKYANYEEYVLDGNSKDVTLEDMEGFFILREMTLAKAKAVYGHILKGINQARMEQGAAEGRNYEELTWSMLTSGGGGGVGLDSPGGHATVEAAIGAEKVLIREYYEKVFSTMYFVDNIETGDVLRLFRENGASDLLIGDAESEDNIFIKKTLMLGNYIVAEETLPITGYPLKVSFFEWGGKPYRSYGMIHFIRGMQEAFDKAIQMLILNGILQNNAGWTAPVGSISPADKPQWETRGNDPTYIKEFIPVVIDGQVFRPERDKIQQLSNFYPQIMEMMRQGMEYSTGVNPLVQGDPKANIEVFSSLQVYQGAAMERVKLAAGHLNTMKVAVGKVVIEYLLANIKPSQNYQFFDGSGKLAEITIAQSMMRDFKKIKYRVLATPAQAQPSQRLAIATELFKVAQTSQDPNERKLFIDKAIQLSDIPEVDGIMEQLDQIKNLGSQIEQMEEQMKRDKELMKQWENKALQAEYKARLMEMLVQGTQPLIEKQAAIESQLDMKQKQIDKEQRMAEQAQTA